MEPLSPRASRAMRDRDLRVVANEPTLVVQAPDEVDVLTEAQGVVEAVGERVSSNDQTRTGDVGDGRTGAHDAAGRPHVEWAEVAFEPVAHGRPGPTAYPWRRRADQWVVEVCRQTTQYVERVVDHDVGVDEPEQRSRRGSRPGVAGRARAHVSFESYECDPILRRALGDHVGLHRSVVDHRHVQPRQALQERAQRRGVVVHGDDDLDVVDDEVRLEHRSHEAVLHESAR